MQRILLTHLNQWLNASARKPLILRGARQVGKTWLIRQLALENKKELVELNFEKNPRLASLFESNDPQQILLNISSLHGQKIIPAKCILFLDEIQSAPALLSKLRWFAEDLPQLPVVATGSLLEFVITNHTFSMPVGRVNYMHLEPLSFEEFLLANNEESLSEYLFSYQFPMQIPDAIHDKLIKRFKEYVFVGGMPAVVVNWIAERSLHQVSQIQNDLLATYRDDFSKFNGRIPIDRLDDVMMAVPKMLGEKFVFKNVNPDVQSRTIKAVLKLLGKARLCHQVKSCAANGVPLGAESNDKFFKEIFLDTGLCSTALGLGLDKINLHDITVINNGGIAEQVVGQLLRTITPPYIEPTLHYWLRQEKTSNAEIDYVIQYQDKVIPVEVKAGSTGSLKSLHLFMEIKNYDLAVRINSNLPSKTVVNVKGQSSQKINYVLLSLPFYLLGQLHRIIQSNI